MSLADWVVDYVYLAKGNLAFRRKPPRHFIGSKTNEKTPVILLSGLALKWTFLRHLGNAISKKGHPVYVVPDLRRNLATVPNSAKMVRAIIDKYAMERVIIVGHSKGGIIGKYILLHRNHDKAIKHVIAIASPFSGAWMARHVPHRSVHEMAPESQVIRELTKNTSSDSKITSIIPEYDNHVREGSFLHGAHNFHVAVRGHHKVVFNKNVEAIILDILARESELK